MPAYLKYKPTKSIDSKLSLKHVRWLGQKRIKILKEAHITNKLQLLDAINSNQLEELFTPALLKKIKNDIHKPKKYIKNLKLYKSIPMVTMLVNHLNEIKQITRIGLAGDYRRRTEVVNDVKIVILATNIKTVKQEILKFEEVKEVIDDDQEKLTIVLQSGLAAYIYFATKENYVTMQLYQTGSKKHIDQLEKLAKKERKKLTRDGLYTVAGKHLVSNDEKNIYMNLKLDFIAPELREGTDEITCAQKKALPTLIELHQIKGDLHAHTIETDGIDTIEAMAQAAHALGYEYLSISDHSKNLKITNGMDEKRLLKQIDQINKLNTRLNHFTILKSIEVDILSDGSLDLSNDVLKELDLCVCSLHSLFRLSREKQTTRILKAMDNPYFNILGHATGRLIHFRDPYDIDIEQIFLAAKERGCIIEVNAQPSRLDINHHYCRIAKEMGVKLAISSDAHSISELKLMKFGVFEARRGWIEANDVINTFNLSNLRRILRRV